MNFPYSEIYICAPLFRSLPVLASDCAFTPYRPQQEASQLQYHANIALIGDVSAPQFPVWITRHAEKLGVSVQISAPVQGQLTVGASGAEEMVQALALACSLGPQSVSVDEMICTPINPETFSGA